MTAAGAATPARATFPPPANRVHPHRGAAIPDPNTRRALLAWYDSHRRDLPWRAAPGERADPYRVWLSEVMLQQTRVEAVRPYFERWVARFPTLAALAAAEPDEVMKAWEGLGYYSRARNLHRAVREVEQRYGGRVPDDPDAFRALPGVGRYTAGAVMSIAFGREEPVVDGNVRRVLARWANEPQPSESTLWAAAGELVRGERPGDLNQAVMELGATVCTPRSPRCGSCPVSGRCGARAAGTQDAVPAPRRARPLPHERVASAVIHRGGEVLLARRPPSGRLGGLWEFPGVELREGESHLAAAERAGREALGSRLTPHAELGAVDHVFTHVRVTYTAVRCTLAGAEPRPLLYDDLRWLPLARLGELALPRAQQRLAGLAPAG